VLLLAPGFPLILMGGFGFLVVAVWLLFFRGVACFALLLSLSSVCLYYLISVIWLALFVWNYGHAFGKFALSFGLGGVILAWLLGKGNSIGYLGYNDMECKGNRIQDKGLAWRP